MLDVKQPPRTTSWMSLIVIVIGAAVMGWYTVYTGRGIALMYEESQSAITHNSDSAVQKIEFDPKAAFFVPSPDSFVENQSWMYVAKTSPLTAKFQPVTLTTVALPAGEHDGTIQLRQNVAQALTRLFAAATADDYHLMITSAYRSIDDQKKLYDEFVAKKGEAAAKQYVLSPGTSEHHTGYAVDITDASDACTTDTDRCILSPATAAWLAERGPDFGFIIRYPSGKEPITGIAHEPWHLRYVGVVLARRLTVADLTLDEFIEQVAPGRIRQQYR